MDDDSPGGNGSDWPVAFDDLQDALSGASQSFGDDIIYVAEGFYTPGTQRESTFDIPAGTEVRGGYLGTENVTMEGPQGSYTQTILSGDIDGTPSDPSGDVYHVVTVAGTAVLLDGFQIRHGNANGSLSSQKRGAGIRVGASEVHFRNLTIRKCQALQGGGALVEPGVYKILWSYCTFRDNQADEGAGYFHDGSFTSIDGVRLYNCLFDRNAADEDGGAIWYKGQSFFMMNCNIRDNTAMRGAGIFNDGNVNVDIIMSSTIAFNVSVRRMPEPGCRREGARLFRPSRCGRAPWAARSPSPKA